MKKKIFMVVVLFAGLFMIWLIVQSVREFHQKRVLAERIQNLPAFHLTDLQGKEITSADILKKKPAVLIYFKTTCPFCQAEIKDLQKHPVISKYARIFLISRESHAAVMKFYQDYHLSKIPGLDILLDPDHTFHQKMGVSSFPNTFVYNTHGHLIKHFRGETAAKVIEGTLEE